MNTIEIIIARFYWSLGNVGKCNWKRYNDNERIINYWVLWRNIGVWIISISATPRYLDWDHLIYCQRRKDKLSSKNITSIKSTRLDIIIPKLLYESLEKLFIPWLMKLYSASLTWSCIPRVGINLKWSLSPSREKQITTRQI